MGNRKKRVGEKEREKEKRKERKEGRGGQS
jgi:hypothetical protein